PDYSWQIFYSRYVATYIDRDVEDIINIKNKSRFVAFFVAVASRCGQLLNVAALVRSAGISVPTAESWLSVLIGCNIIYLLKPYTGDVEKRATRTPKVYFTDTGLCAYLCGITTPEQMKTSPMRAEFFENFVISEIIKGYYNAGRMDLPLYFYRDHNQKEIDLVISRGDVLYPIEIKAHADPAKKEISAFKALDEIPGKRRGPGGVVCLYDRLSTLDERDVGREKILDRVIPVTYL
ncbi:MAG: DUF4143 domain-containing protein, partial [Clostridia bacterium]|nr:DUF4143 domain-containing protein [Clostridia bacterium]